MPEETLNLQEVRRSLLVDAVSLLKRHENVYKKDPQLFFKERGINFFPTFERMFNQLYSTEVLKAVALGPRGGGKTFGAAIIATAFFLFKDYDVGIVAGSETQALTLFGYITDWLDLAEEEEQLSDAVERIRHSDLVGKTGNRIVAKTASPKSIRGMHLGRGKRGALLIIDEEAETDDDVMKAARYTVRTAKPAIILRMSTYHKLTGSFPDLVENHKELGYELFSWDSFDIAKPCAYECENCPVPEFKDKYCKGKAKRSNGWIDVNEIVGEWKDSPKDTFEVEIMGMRPASTGLVIQIPDIDRAIDLGSRGFPVQFDYSWFCIDWGFASMTAVVILGIAGDTVFVRHTEMFSRHGIDPIVEKLRKLRDLWGVREVFGDSSHPFENKRMRDEGFAVWSSKPEDPDATLGVVFNTFKEEGVSNLAYLFEKGKIGIRPSEHMLLRQLRRWRRDEGGHIVKKEDHFPDALVAGMMKLEIEGIGMGRRRIRIQSLKRRVFSVVERFAGGIARVFKG